LSLDNDPLKYLPLIGIGIIALHMLAWIAVSAWSPTASNQIEIQQARYAASCVGEACRKQVTR